MNESLAILEKLLQAHDWTYEFSDDYTAWHRGKGERSAINQEQKRLIESGLVTVEEVQELTHKYAPKG